MSKIYTLTKGSDLAERLQALQEELARRNENIISTAALEDNLIVTTDGSPSNTLEASGKPSRVICG